MNHILCFTDGSSIGNPGPGGWAYLMGDDIFHLDTLLAGNFDLATNNEMEMFAVLMAVNDCPSNCILTIATDSKLVIGWLSKGWAIKSNPRIQQIRSAIENALVLKSITLKFAKVDGHSGMPQNERVDTAARNQALLAKQRTVF